MALQKVDDTDYLIKSIDDMIRDLQARKAEIMARRPVRKKSELMTHMTLPNGQVRPIKGRCQR